MKKIRVILIMLIAFGAITLAIASNKYPKVTRYYYENENNTGLVFSVKIESPCITGGTGCFIPTEIGDRQLYATKIHNYWAIDPMRH
ncbi:hypothetical protein [Chitinophaga sp. MM2321]|uniref:hypothetical protein n=1 Tax=Chitinophaga sp. MM2321 TaxID=3137178 RepID=UPI0032D5A5B3